MRILHPTICNQKYQHTIPNQAEKKAAMEKKGRVSNNIWDGSTQEVSSLVPHFKVAPVVHSLAPSSPKLGTQHRALGHQPSPDILAQLQLLTETQKKLEQVRMICVNDGSILI